MALDLLNIGISVRDPDYFSGNIAVKFTASEGIFEAVAGDSAVTVAGFGSPILTLTGTANVIKNFFNRDKSTGSLIYDSESEGNKTITVEVTDASGLVTSKSFVIRVRQTTAPSVDIPDSSFVADIGVPKEITHATAGMIDADDLGRAAEFSIIAVGGTLELSAGNSGITILDAGTEITWEGLWDNVTAYTAGDVVNHNNLLWVAKVDNTNKVPVTNSDNWRVFKGATPAPPFGWLGYATATPDNPASNLTDFVFVLDLTQMPSEWWDIVAEDGRDIRVSTSANVMRPRDIISFDKDNQTGLISFKFTKSTSGEEIRVWAGNPNAVDVEDVDADEGRYAVYPSSIIGFWPYGAGYDRTVYKNHFVTQGTLSVGGQQGPLNSSKATRFSQGNYGLATTVVPDVDPISLMGIARLQVDDTRNLIDVSDGTTSVMSLVQYAGLIGGDPIRVIRNNSAVAATSVGFALNSWVHFTGVFEAANSRLVYRNGGSVGTNGTNLAAGNASGIYVGRSGSNVATFGGDCTLLSAHTNAISANWTAYHSEMLQTVGFWNGWIWTDSISGGPVSIVTGQGSATQINAFLADDTTGSVMYTPVDTGNQTLIYEVVDGDGIQDTGSQTINNGHPPVVTVPATDITAEVLTDTDLHGIGFSVTDADDAGGTAFAQMIVTLGTISVDEGDSGVSGSIPGNGTGSLTFSGTIAQIRDLLEGTSTGTILYTHTVEGSGTITLQVTDSTTRVGSASQMINVVADPDAWVGYAFAVPVASQAAATGHVAFINLSFMPDEWWAAVTTDGRDIRVTDDADANIARDLETFDYENQTGRLIIPYNLTVSPAEVRVWVGAGAAVAPAVGDTYGQYNTYHSNIKMFYPNGGDQDRTVNNRDLFAVNPGNIDFGANPGILGGNATNYNGFERAETSTATPDARSFYCYYNADAISNNHGIVGRYNFSSAVQTLGVMFSGGGGNHQAKSNTVGLSHNAYTPVGATTGTWNVAIGFFPSANARKITINGGNLGTDPGTAAHTFGDGQNYITGGCRIDTGHFRYFDGLQGPIMFHSETGGSNATCLALADHYYAQLDQETYWGGGWTWTADTILGL